jgi:hypothetical protein
MRNFSILSGRKQIKTRERHFWTQWISFSFFSFSSHPFSLSFPWLQSTTRYAERNPTQLCAVALTQVLRRDLKLKIKLKKPGLHNVVLRDRFEWWIGKGVAGTGGGLPDMLGKIWRNYVTPSRKQHLFSEFKTETPNLRLKICGKNTCYKIQHQVLLDVTDRHGEISS